MAWYSDEQWEYMQDTKDKSITARSARSTRSHCGKGGKVKLPSDYMTKKELNAMNGECKSYRLNSPMTFEEFVSMPDDLKVMYIKALREKYKVPGKVLANAMGAAEHQLRYHVNRLGLGLGKGAAAAGRHWHNSDDSIKFWTWWHGVKEELLNDDDASENPVEETDIPETVALEEVVDKETAEKIEDLCEEAAPAFIQEQIPEFKDDPIISTTYHMPVIPKKGTITFENNLADDALDTIKCILSNARVCMAISWECAFEE